jgi:hypothetical protein
MAVLRECLFAVRASHGVDTPPLVPNPRGDRLTSRFGEVTTLRTCGYALSGPAKFAQACPAVVVEVASVVNVTAVEAPIH